MNNLLDVLLLGNNEDRHARLADTLSRLGFSIRVSPDLPSFYENYFRQPSPLVVLNAPLPDIHNAAVRLRASDRGVGIVAVAAFPDSDSRVRTLLCGADACLAADVDGLELAAALQALLRRGASPDAGEAAAEAKDEGQAAGPWRLANKGWTLVAPSGHELGLTTGERDFLCRLARAPDRKVSRDAFGEHAEDGDAPGTRLRFLDVMVSRLRRKAAAHAMMLPIRAVHGWGYMFAADIVLDARPAQAANEASTHQEKRPPAQRRPAVKNG
ncbi:MULTISPECIES: winged helix-turn-helix domain-containing protein [unclassified Achromobacter]|uniref:response regulator transcription factor n=1 Tax=unclassified Achromobacter TaxID=2626865 RepID=UPI0009EB7C71|nr:MULTISPECIES: winged helix-turn-helix domain-containing protein [unclassified Achromobacter]